MKEEEGIEGDAGNVGIDGRGKGGRPGTRDVGRRAGKGRKAGNREGWRKRGRVGGQMIGSPQHGTSGVVVNNILGENISSRWKW